MFKNNLYNVLGVLGGYYISRKITRNNTRILMYHRFGDRGEFRKTDLYLFDEQISFILKNYDIISLNDYVSNLKNNVKRTKPVVVITIDDGYKDFYYYAYPILKKYNVPATVFLVTDFLEKKIWLWPDIIEYIIQKTDRSMIEYINNEVQFKIPVNSIIERRLAWSEICNYCLIIENPRKLDFIDELKTLLRVKIPGIPPKEYAPLAWNDIRSIMNNNIEFGSHTITHPILTKIPLEDLEKEITESKRILEHKLQKEINSFCYPQGRTADYNDIIKNKVKKAGYQCAVTTNEGLNSRRHDLYELNRISCGQQHFIKNVTGVSYLLNKFQNSLKDKLKLQ